MGMLENDLDEALIERRKNAKLINKCPRLDSAHWCPADCKLTAVGRSSDSPTGGGRKDDKGKAPVYQGVLRYFPRALEAVARVSEYGSKKYAWGVDWWHLEDAFERYSDAMLRHTGKEAIEEKDQESSLPHAWHAAWCALGRLEVLLVEAEKKDPSLGKVLYDVDELRRKFSQPVGQTDGHGGCL